MSNTFTEEDNDEIIDMISSLSLVHKSVQDDELNKKIAYHLCVCTVDEYTGDQDVIKCHRFDLEQELSIYDPEFYYNFKLLLIQNAKHVIIEKSRQDKVIMSSLEGYISQYFYELVCKDIIVSGKNTWYLENGRWFKTNGIHMLWSLFDSNFFVNLRNEPYLAHVVDYLQSITAKKRILEDIKMKLNYPKFESKLNSKKNLIGLKNGTFNTETFELQDAISNDFISICTKSEYIRYTMEHSEIKWLLKILNQVFPNKDVLKFFIRSCSTFLEAQNSKKVFYVWWGYGNNCKTGMTTLVQRTLGEYCATAPVSLITGNRNASGSATPELCHIENKLVVFLQEPNQKEEMKTGRIKELTGNDKIFIRQLYEVPREIDVKCKIIHVCNFPTVSSNTDIAFKKRLVVIPFMSTFLNDDDYARKKKLNILGEHMYKMNEHIDALIPYLNNAFLYLLIEDFRVFKAKGLEIPDIIKDKTEEFLVFNNYCLKFIRKQIIYSDECEDGIQTCDIYEIFKMWFKNLYPGRAIPNSEVFCSELRDEGYPEDENGVVFNIRLVSNDSDF